MQLKTIEKVVKAKMLAWLESITDPQLRERVKLSLLVSGGSITSLFLNEEVNDYDVYIQDRKVLLDLVKYYVKDIPDAEVLNGEERFLLIEQYKGDISTEEFLKHPSKRASALRNLKQDQVKIFIHGDNGGLKVESALANVAAGEEPKKYQVSFLSPNAISLTDQVQIVCRFHGSPEQIHKTFDFIHATNYFTFTDGVVTNKEALESIITKQLRYQGSLYPLTSIIRSKKFVKRNWNIGAGEYLKIMFQISLLDLQNVDVLEEQLIGVDVAYFEMLIKALRAQYERHPDFKITPNYFNAIIDKVFNETE